MTLITSLRTTRILQTVKKNDHLFFFKPLYLQLLSGVLFVLVALTLGASKQVVESIIVGALVMAVNFGIYTWTLKNLVQKKFIAISVILIVFKWAILGFTIYYLANRIHGLGVAIGLTTIVPAFVLWFISGNPFEERE